MYIDKSRFTAEELETYEALIAKGKVDPAANHEEMKEDTPPAVPPKKAKKAEVENMEDTKKSAPAAPAAAPEVPDFVKDAIAKSEAFIEKAEKKDMVEVAKKYAVLVESVDDLAEKLYNLKKSDPAMYDQCIAMMDKQASMIEKSGLFAEIGKSAGGHSTSGGAVAKAQAKANEIMKADPNISYDAAIAKAWEDPALAAEYDAEYYGN